METVSAAIKAANAAKFAEAVTAMLVSLLKSSIRATLGGGIGRANQK